MENITLYLSLVFLNLVGIQIYSSFNIQSILCCWCFKFLNNVWHTNDPSYDLKQIRIKLKAI